MEILLAPKPLIINFRENPVAGCIEIKSIIHFTYIIRALRTQLYRWCLRALSESDLLILPKYALGPRRRERTPRLQLNARAVNHFAR